MYLFHLIFVNLILISCTTCWRSRSTEDSDTEEWTGRWFPEKSTSPMPEITKSREEVSREMGVRDICDDGKTHLEIDIPEDETVYLCLHPNQRETPDPTLPPVKEFENIPKAYEADHRCMNETISYFSPVPTFGTHRKLWPVFGEYKYLPPQRWIHTLEHGGIVGLYHPCADLYEISLFRNTIRNCLRRHVITPYSGLPKDRPFGLVAWGVREYQSWVSPYAIREFIQSHALQGPEKVSRDGQYYTFLMKKAEVISDEDDSQLCPMPLSHD